MKNPTGLEPFAPYLEDAISKAEAQRAYDAGDPPCTPKQRGYIYGMCKKLDYAEHDLPVHVSPISEPRLMRTSEASAAIEILRIEVEEEEAVYFCLHGEKKRYGKNAKK